MNRNRKYLFEFIIAVFIFYVFLFSIGITCPIKALTGVSCPSCGMTRAWISVLKLDFKSAFYFHPLFIMPLLYLIVFLLQKYIPSKIIRLLFILSLIIIFIVYFMRMADASNDIVVFRPFDSLIYKFYSKIFSLF